MSTPYITGSDALGMIWSDGKRRTPEDVKAMLKEAGPQQDEFSARELRVMELVAEGFTNKEIAKLIGRSEFTVADCLRHLHKKLRCTNGTRANVVARAFRAGIIE